MLPDVEIVFQNNGTIKLYMPLPASPPQYTDYKGSSENNQLPVASPQSDTSDSQKTRFRIPIGIILLIIYGIVLYGIVGYSIYKKNALENSSYTEQASSDKESFQLPKYEDIILTTDTLPIVELPLMESYVEATKSMYPIPIPVQVSKDFWEKVSRYRFGSLVFIGPKGWVGEGDITKDGIFPYLYPIKDMDTGPYLKGYISSKGNRAGLLHASQFFRWIRDHASELKIENDLMPIAKQSSYSAITNHLISYSDTVTLGPEFEIYGFAFSDAEDHFQDQQWSTLMMEISLPKEERQFAQDIVNIFIQQYDLKNK